MTEHPGGQPFGGDLQFQALRDAGQYRQIIENIEYLLDANSPGDFTRLALTEFRDEVTNTILYVRFSQKNYSDKKIVLENLRKARASLQLSIDDFAKKARLYKQIEQARQNLEEALSAW